MSRRNGSNDKCATCFSYRSHFPLTLLLFTISYDVGVECPVPFGLMRDAPVLSLLFFLHKPGVPILSSDLIGGFYFSLLLFGNLLQINKTFTFTFLHLQVCYFSIDKNQFLSLCQPGRKLQTYLSILFFKDVKYSCHS